MGSGAGTLAAPRHRNAAARAAGRACLERRPPGRGTTQADKNRCYGRPAALVLWCPRLPPCTNTRMGRRQLKSPLPAIMHGRRTRAAHAGGAQNSLEIDGEASERAGPSLQAGRRDF